MVSPAALVLGGADCLWEDVEALESLLGRPWPGIVIAANDAGYVWPRFLDHWVSMHVEKFTGVAQPPDFIPWERRRAENPDIPPEYRGGYLKWGRRAPRLVDRIVEEWDGGSSGMLCLPVARELGCSGAVLCGMPMTPTQHFHDEGQGGAGPWFVADRYWKRWLRQLHRIWTLFWDRTLFGECSKTTPDS